MIVGGAIVKRFGKLISEAERRTIERIREGRMRAETSITDTFLADVEMVFKEKGETEDMTVSFKAWWLPPKPEERDFGADFCGVLSVRSSQLSYTKGFLAQAKMSNQGISCKSSFRGLFPVSITDGVESRRLKGQIDKMLAVTPDSFVVVYSSDGFVVIPATSIRGLSGSGTIYGKPVPAFFKEYLMCFVGDQQLQAADHDSLDKLRRKTASRAALMFQVVKE